MWRLILRYVLNVIFVAIIGLIGFGAGNVHKSNLLEKSNIKPQVKWELLSVSPFFFKNCVSPTPKEYEIYELAVDTLEQTREFDPVGLQAMQLELGSQGFLSQGLIRKVSMNYSSVCPPKRIYEKAGEIITKYRGFIGRIGETQLKLAEKIPNPSPYIIQAVANSAFNDTPQESEIESFKMLGRHRDIRPLARSVLASFGKQAAPYENIAYNQISSKDALGTGAAQVAVAGGNINALQKVESIMNETLSSIPKTKSISLETRDRLYELAYAIYFGGENAKQYTAPIKEIMARKVESWAPPYGKIELNPKRLCWVLKSIEGDISIQKYPYCLDNHIPFEQ